jgi:hypothetical protein
MTILIILVAVAAMFFLIKSRMANESNAKMADIPAIFEKLRATGKDANFATFCFGISDKSVSDNAVNVQFSIEGGRIGFDWILICKINIRDKDKFMLLAERLGHKVVAGKWKNGVEYLRVEDGNLPKLCEASIRELYAMPPDADLELVLEGFTWP